jgi:hypothetical protein
VCAKGCRHRSISAAVAAARNGAAITVEPGIYEEGYPGGYGGGLEVDKDLTIRRCGSTGDVVLRNTDPYGYGASLTVWGDKVTVEDITFTRNPDLEFGGKIINWGHLTLINCTVTGCVSQPHIFAGGIHNGGTLTMRGGKVTENRAPGGAGIYNEGSATSIDPEAGTVTLVGVEVSRNVATSDGAGIASQDSRTTVTLTDCTVKDNIADQGGGGIASSGVLRLTNTTVLGNTSKYNSGGGIVGGGREMIIEDCTVTGNAAAVDGGGIYHGWSGSPGTFSLRGTTVTGNTPNNCVGTIPIEGCEA